MKFKSNDHSKFKNELRDFERTHLEFIKDGLLQPNSSQLSSKFRYLERAHKEFYDSINKLFANSEKVIIK